MEEAEVSQPQPCDCPDVGMVEQGMIIPLSRRMAAEKFKKAAASVGKHLFLGLIANGGFAALELAARFDSRDNGSGNA